MDEPIYWYILSGLFVLAGLLNLLRGRRSDPFRRPVRSALGFSCFIWAGATLAFRFVGATAGYIIGALAFLVMGLAAYQSARSAK